MVAVSVGRNHLLNNMLCAVSQTAVDPIQKKKISEVAAGTKYRSKLSGPISDLSVLRQSLLFAELATISYMDEAEATKAVLSIGFEQSEFFERDGSQSYIFTTAHDKALVFRGTEPNEWNDIKADANAVSAVAETFGRVHRGFKQEVDDLWPRLEETLVAAKESAQERLWFAGHSLGGAMATICAGRCKLSHISANPEGIFTFGSPRVGNKRYINYCNLTHYRWVNNNDIVTRVPPPWMGYRHGGVEMYLDHNGDLRTMKGWRRTKDRLAGFWGGLWQGRVDHFSDHSMTCYMDHIHNAICADEGISST